jgi:hypothetical protein
MKTDKLKELENWLKEDKTICKADRDYICDFITKNYIPRDKVEGLKMEYNNELGEIYNNAVDEINQKIKEVLE